MNASGSRRNVKYEYANVKWELKRTETWNSRLQMLFWQRFTHTLNHQWQIIIIIINGRFFLRFGIQLNRQKSCCFYVIYCSLLFPVSREFSFLMNLLIYLFNAYFLCNFNWIRFSLKKWIEAREKFEKLFKSN